MYKHLSNYLNKKCKSNSLNLFLMNSFIRVPYIEVIFFHQMFQLFYYKKLNLFKEPIFSFTYKMSNYSI